MREGDIHLIEAHVSGYCFDGDRILAVKRTPKRKIYPKLWETGGKSIEKLDKLDFIPGVREDIAKAWKQLKSKSK